MKPPHSSTVWGFWLGWTVALEIQGFAAVATDDFALRSICSVHGDDERAMELARDHGDWFPTARTVTDHVLGVRTVGVHFDRGCPAEDGTSRLDTESFGYHHDFHGSLAYCWCADIAHCSVLSSLRLFSGRNFRVTPPNSQ